MKVIAKMIAHMVLASMVLGPAWLIMYWEFIDQDPTVYQSNQTVLQDPAPNDPTGFTVSRQICASSDVKITVDRLFVDGVDYQMPPRPPVQLKQGCQTREGLIKYPKSLNPGRYRFRVILHVPLNPLRTRDVQLNDVEIQIPEFNYAVRNEHEDMSVITDHTWPENKKK